MVLSFKKALIASAASLGLVLSVAASPASAAQTFHGAAGGGSFHANGGGGSFHPNAAVGRGNSFAGNNFQGHNNWHGGGWHGGGYYGNGYGWGALGAAGLAAGAILGDGYYDGYDGCVTYQPMYDAYGNYLGQRPINAC